MKKYILALLLCLPFLQGQVNQTGSTGWFIDANIASTNTTNIGLATNSQSSYAVLTSSVLNLTTKSGSQSVGIACSGQTNTVGTATCNALSVNEMVGITFNAPNTGLFKVCVEFGYYARPDQLDESGQFTWELIRTPNNADSITEEGGSRVQSFYYQPTNTANELGAFPYNLCGNFNLTPTQVTIKLMYESNIVGGNNTLNNGEVYADAQGTNGQRDIHFTVVPVSFKARHYDP